MALMCMAKHDVHGTGVRGTDVRGTDKCNVSSFVNMYRLTK